jgi:copper chaperone CopZ
MQFKTNIHCQNCLRAVTGFLNEVPGITQWNVDTDNPDKILTVEGAAVDQKAVIAAVEEAGFDITPLHQPEH